MEFVSCYGDRFRAIDDRCADPLKVCDDLFAVLRRCAAESRYKDINIRYRFPVICNTVSGAADMELKPEGV